MFALKTLSFFLSIFLFSFTSCARKEKPASAFVLAGDTLQVDYADGFSIYYHNDFKEVVVYNPWKTDAVYARYYLVKNESAQVPGDGTKVRIPLRDIALTSVTQIEFMRMLGELETVTGMCSPALVYNAELRERIASNNISDLGDSFSINVEKTLKLSPAAVMTSGYNQNDPNMLRISQANIPVLYNNEWMENSLLGRAEWIKFAGAFYDKEQIADSLFFLVAENYKHLEQLAGTVGERPQVMSGSAFRGTWYVPGGNSFMGRLFKDAGAAYYYADDTSTGSLPLNMETVIMNFSKADIWLNSSFNAMEELLASDQKYALFQAVSQNKVYNFNKRMLTSGANDFWESAVARPDFLLADVIAILHPSLLISHQLVYAEKLK